MVFHTRSERSRLWFAVGYSFRMGSPCRVWIVDLISNEGIAAVGLLRAVRLRLGWPCVILWSAGLLCSEVGSTFSCPRFWRVLYVWASNRRRSGSWPFFFWPFCLSPPSGVGSASAAWRVLYFTWAMPCGVFPAWLACGVFPSWLACWLLSWKFAFLFRAAGLPSGCLRFYASLLPGGGSCFLMLA